MAATIQFNGGKNTAQDRSELQNGQLQAASGCWYKPGDTRRIWKKASSEEWGDTGSAAAVKGVHIATFDDTADRVLAYSGTTIYSAFPGESGSPVSLITGLNSSAKTFRVAHALDRHFIANGYDRLKALESDGTSRDAGMQAPVEQVVAAAANTASAVSRPDASTGGANNESFSRDADVNTYADLTLSAAGTATQTWTWASNAESTRTLTFLHKLAGLPIDGFGPEGDGGGGTGVGVGGDQDSGYNVTIKLEVSEDSGDNWTTLFNITRTSAHSEPIAQQSQITAANDSTVTVRATLTYNSGVGQASWRAFDVKMDPGSETTAFSTTARLLYSYAEFDQLRGITGPIVEPTEVSLTSQSLVTLTFPASAINSNATHLIPFRSAEGGGRDELGRIGMIPIGTTKFVDDFVKYPSTTGPDLLSAMVQVSHQGKTLFIPRDTPPPLMDGIYNFKNTLIGFRGRTVSWAIAGRPESWPEWNLIGSFQFKENDNLVGGTPVGDSFLWGAKGVMIVMDDIPRVVAGIYNLTTPRPLEGQPGLVGIKAIASYSVEGEDRAAWVSPFGIIETNGLQSRWLTRDLDWKNEVNTRHLDDSVLEWDKERQVLVFAGPKKGSKTNNGEWLLHMAPEHRLSSGLPKITGATTVEIKDLAAGLANQVHYFFSGHPSDGKVYREAQSFGGTMTFTGPRIYQDMEEFETSDAVLRHTDCPTPATVTWRVGRDGTSYDNPRDHPVSCVGHRGTYFHPLASGEWAEATVTIEGDTEVAFQDIRARVRVRGSSGAVAV